MDHRTRPPTPGRPWRRRNARWGGRRRRTAAPLAALFLFLALPACGDAPAPAGPDAPPVAEAPAPRASVMLGPEVRITDDPDDQMWPEIWGDRVVWTDHRNGASDVYLFDFATGDETRITDDPALQFNPTVSGGRIAFNDRRDGPHADVYLFDLATGRETRITTEPSTQAFPQVSELRIVWQDLRNSCGGVTPCDRSGNDDIYGYDARDGQVSPVITHPAAQQQPHLRGDRAVWQDWRNGLGDIYMFDFSTGVESPVTASPGHERQPRVSGDLVVYDDFGDVFVTDVATGRRTRITGAAESQTLADVHGHRIVWTDLRHGHCDVYLFDLVTGTETRLTDDPGCQGIPRIWGSRVVWMDNRNGDWDIYARELVPPTLDDLLEALEECVAAGLIRNAGVAAALGVKLERAKDAEARGGTAAALGLLDAFVNELGASAGRTVGAACSGRLIALARAVSAELDG